jgi:hypothetical protein
MFVCNICQLHNETPREYYCSVDQMGRRRDVMERPELARGSCEFVVPSAFMVYLSIYRSITLPLYLSIDHSIYLSITLQLYRSITLQLYRSITLSICVSPQATRWNRLRLRYKRTMDHLACVWKKTIESKMHLSIYLSIYIYISLGYMTYNVISCEIDPYG